MSLQSLQLADIQQGANPKQGMDESPGCYSGLAEIISKYALKIFERLSYIFMFKWFPSFRSTETAKNSVQYSHFSTNANSLLNGATDGSNGVPKSDLRASSGERVDKQVIEVAGDELQATADLVRTTAVDVLSPHLVTVEDGMASTIPRISIIGKVIKTRTITRMTSQKVLISVDPKTDDFYQALESVTPDQRNAINNIVLTLGDESKTPNLGLMDEIPKVKNIPLLVFAAVVFSDRALTENFAHSRTIKREVDAKNPKRAISSFNVVGKKIQDARVKLYNDAVKNLQKAWGGLDEEVTNRFKRNLHSFSYKMGLNPDKIRSLCETGNYEAVFDLLIRAGSNQELAADERYKEQYETSYVQIEEIEPYEVDDVVGYREESIINEEAPPS